MRRLLSVALLLVLGGCMRSYRYEHSHYAAIALHTDGTCCSHCQAKGAERSWRGPWPARPSRFQP